MKKKIFPLKLEDNVYSDLKQVARYAGKPMSVIIRSHFKQAVQKQALAIRNAQENNSLSKFLDQYVDPNNWLKLKQSDDQLLYGQNDD